MSYRPRGSFFERAFGLAEEPYDATRQFFSDVERISKDPFDGRDIATFALPSNVRRTAGTFYTPSLGDLRGETARLIAKAGSDGVLHVEHVASDVMEVHRTCRPWSTVQAASQFNCLEMINPQVTPEDGITIYENDPTQGPQCAMAAPAGTAYRNYLVPHPLGGLRGQSRSWQLNTFADVSAIIDREMRVNRQVHENRDESVFRMSNGYLDVRTADDLLKISKIVEAQRTALESALRIGVQRDTECVAAASPSPGSAKLITQTFNSAIGISYSRLRVPTESWKPLATMVLRASYEATLHVGLQNALRSALRGVPPSPIYLTFLGGGVFGNPTDWVCDAINTSIQRVAPLVSQSGLELSVCIVHYRNIDASVMARIPKA